MKSQTEDEYDYADIEDDLTLAERIIASRKMSFPALINDYEYFDALVSVSKRVRCFYCNASKKQACRGCMHGEPAHKSRMRLLTFSSKEVYSNVLYAIKSKHWKGDSVIALYKGKYRIVMCDHPDWKRMLGEK